MNESLIELRVKNPIEITQAVRNIITDNKRVIDMKTERDKFNPEITLVSLDIAPAHIKHRFQKMEIPNQTRPHRIFESMEPVEDPLDIVDLI